MSTHNSKPPRSDHSPPREDEDGADEESADNRTYRAADAYPDPGEMAAWRKVTTPTDSSAGWRKEYEDVGVSADPHEVTSS